MVYKQKCFYFCSDCLYIAYFNIIGTSQGSAKAGLFLLGRTPVAAEDFLLPHGSVKVCQCC